MTETLTFGHGNRNQLVKFITSGPQDWSCRQLAFAGTADDLVTLVTRAREGCIHRLILEAGLSERLFSLPGLSRKPRLMPY